jgi:hypothetical protein
MNPVWVYDDGGRSKYFRSDNVRDCAVRAIAIASGRDYKEVYDALSLMADKSVRNGTPKKIDRAYIEKTLGWKWTPLMGIGTGCTHHVRADELPSGTIIVQASKHLICVKDGVVHDTCDSTRGGTRCAYGYWRKAN